MSTIEDLKSLWQQHKDESEARKGFDQAALHSIVKTRAKKHLNTVMRYFWASFSLQILVYALLVHVVVKYGADQQTVLIGLAGILLFIPFTIMLMRKFKQLAITPYKQEGSAAAINGYLERQHMLLKSFYRFKKRYELVLIPLSTAIGTFLTFQLYFPGGIMAYRTAALTVFAMALVSCAAAIFSENKKCFEQPLQNLEQLLQEFKGMV